MLDSKVVCRTLNFLLSSVRLPSLPSSHSRYRYLSSSGGHEVKWVPLQSEGSNGRGKLISELLQLLRRVLSAPLPDSAHIQLQTFCRSRFQSDETVPVSERNHPELADETVPDSERNHPELADETMPDSERNHPELADETVPDLERNHLELADSSMPLLALIYTDRSLLTKLLKLLYTSTSSSSSAEEKPQAAATKGATAVPPNLVQQLFCNFIHFLDTHCHDHSCFFQPLLAVLESQGEGLQASKEFQSLVGRLTLEFGKEDNWEKVLSFTRQGGAKLIFECLVSACKHSHPSPGTPLSKSITKLGQKDIPKPFRENSSLVNFLPLASIKLTPNRTPIRDLRSSGLSEHPSRSSTFHHTYHANEDWLKMAISLPYPILLHTLQLYQPVGLVQNGPSAVLLETTCQSSLAPATPLTPLLPTSGLSCIKLELQPPVVAQEVVLHLCRPRVADSISLSHLHLLGVGYGSDTKKEQKIISPDTAHPR